MVECIESSLEDDKALDIAIIDLVGKTSIADRMIVASGNSGRLVNAMADHKVHFLDWWKSSMREAEACEQAAAQPDSVEAREELDQSQRAKQVLGRELQEKIRTLIRSVSEHAQRLEQSHLQGKRLEDTQEIEQASKSALAILDVMLGPDRPAA